MRSTERVAATSVCSSPAAWHIQIASVSSKSRTAGCYCRHRKLRHTSGLPAEDDGMQQTFLPHGPPDPRNFVLRLYVAGQTPKCMRAFSNLKRICEEYLTNRYRIEMIDLMENPTLARGDQ